MGRNGIPVRRSATASADDMAKNHRRGQASPLGLPVFGMDARTGLVDHRAAQRRWIRRRVFLYSVVGRPRELDCRRTRIAARDWFGHRMCRSPLWTAIGAALAKFIRP